MLEYDSSVDNFSWKAVWDVKNVRVTKYYAQCLSSSSIQRYLIFSIIYFSKDLSHHDFKGITFIYYLTTFVSPSDRESYFIITLYKKQLVDDSYLLQWLPITNVSPFFYSFFTLYKLFIRYINGLFLLAFNGVEKK